MKRLNDLKNKSLVFTSDAEIAPEKRKKCQIRYFKKRISEGMLNVPQMIKGHNK